MGKSAKHTTKKQADESWRIYYHSRQGLINGLKTYDRSAKLANERRPIR
jgi:hypothetical protein